MRLMHFSPEEITGPIRSYPTEQRAEMKPGGFWLSDERGGYGWKTWANSEHFRPSHMAYEYYVKLAPKNHILHLNSVEAIDKFTEDYKADSEGNRRAVEFNHNYYKDLPDLYGITAIDRRPTVYDIDWPRVAEKWQGIIITPYQWSRRLTNHTMWYYGWDCASGCIWDADAIGYLKLKTVHKKLVGLKELTFAEEMKNFKQSMTDLGIKIPGVNAPKEDPIDVIVKGVV